MGPGALQLDAPARRVVPHVGVEFGRRTVPQAVRPRSSASHPAAASRFLGRDSQFHEGRSWFDAKLLEELLLGVDEEEDIEEQYHEQDKEDTEM